MKNKKLPFKLSESQEKLLAKRHRREKRFQGYGLAAIVMSFIFLGVLLFSILSKGYTAFYQTQIGLDIRFDKASVKNKNYSKLIRQALDKKFPTVKSRQERRLLYSLISKGEDVKIKQAVINNPKIINTTQKIWLTSSSNVDMFMKGRISADTPEDKRKIKDVQLRWLDKLESNNAIKFNFNYHFFTAGDSRAPEQAGVLGGIIGSLLIILSCIATAFPLGVMTAIYLEEFAPKNRLTDLIEVNINNLAAVPSIVFGLLGLALYINFAGIPRSAAIAGGLTLALLILPIIVITTRNAIKAIPPTIKDAALALGASKMQVIFHHVLPLAMPGIMTGAILGIARALGETAPLLMIGMVAFIADIPEGFFDPATALPVQVFLWSDSPELGFIEKTSAAIIILLIFLIAANALAVYLRKKFEVKW